MTHNGPAIKLVNVTRRKHRAENCPFSLRNMSRCKEGTARVFAVQAENLIEFYECRGTKCDARQLLSPVTEVAKSTGAVSRYKVESRAGCCPRLLTFLSGRGGSPGLSPSQLLSNVQRINAKTVTSLLILLSVLAHVLMFVSPGSRFSQRLLFLKIFVSVGSRNLQAHSYC